tara:strand:- start:3113 stop:3697 length:585 start_codon:yes stop_codon:yes gene_type:complete
MKIEKIITNALLAQTNGIICIEPKINRPPIIAFAGTQNLKELFVHDFNILPTFWPPENKKSRLGGRVHSGFARRTNYLMNTVDEFINKHDNFILGGHSLGGSCAILCASRLININKTVNAVYTFGVPNIGTSKFRDYYKSLGLWNKTTNYITENDFVVNLPFLYKSVGNNYLLEFEEKNGLISHDLVSYDNLVK